MPRLIALLCLFLAFSYEGKAGEPKIQKSITAVSGKLELFLYRRSPIGLYIQFELQEVRNQDTQISINQSPFLKITDQLIPFHLAYNPDEINEQYSYRLNVIVAENANGTNIITTASFATLTQGNPKLLNLMIQQAPEPIE